jgi:regulator of sigma E protease
MYWFVFCIGEKKMQLFQFILGLAALIFIHELGHFAAARLLKVDVEEFGIGFPPRAVKLFEFKGTVYSLNWIPLGGFVRLKGENDPTVPGGFASASPWVRLGILFAGPFMNIVIGLVLASMLFYMRGEPLAKSVFIQEISPGSPAEQADLQIGDYFVAVNGETVEYINDLQDAINRNLGQPTELLMRRGDDTFSIVLEPRTDPPEGQGAMGVVLDSDFGNVGIFTAVDRGVTATTEYVLGVVNIPVRMLQGQATPGEGRLVGYKGMYDIYQRVQAVWFFAMISISLGIMNLLPIPALDGGRIMLTLPEIIIRRRIPAQYENAIHLIGFAALLLLLIYINIQDFVNPIELP